MRIGEYEVLALNAGFFRLDGGAMFGVVPKPLWEKCLPADSRNRIRMALRVLLIRGAGRCALVDCGIGERWNDKERDRYGIEPGHGLLPALAAVGVSARDVTDVILTHLHFDHVGGATTSEGKAAFPNARYHVQGRNLHQAARATPRDRASFREDLIAPLRKEGRLSETTGSGELFTSVFVTETNGHCPGHQVVRVGKGDGGVLFAGDSIPTAHHVSPAWLAAYDLDPVLAMREKERLLRESAERGDVVVWDHDPQCEASRIEVSGERFVAVPASLGP